MKNKISSGKKLFFGISLTCLSFLLLAGQPSERLILVGGALTEIVYALGAEDLLVGVDTTSLYPDAATKLPQVGYQRSLSAEGMLSLSPTRIIHSNEAGPEVVLQQVEATGVKMLQLPKTYSADGVASNIEAIAAVVGKADLAVQLTADFRQRMAEIAKKVDGHASTDAPKVLFLLNVGQGSTMAAGLNTGADAMIKMAGGTNVLDAFEGYKPISAESMIVANPDYILLTNRTHKILKGADGVLKLPGVALTKAGKSRQIISMNGLYLLGFSLRLPEAIADLNNQLF